MEGTLDILECINKKSLLYDQEVVGSISSRVKLKTLKLVVAAIR